MGQAADDPIARNLRRGGFATTHWSMVLAAGARSSPESDDALAILCETYWYPLYAYVRRQGHDADAARDLTQAFFTRLLEKDYLHAADRERGKFRSFLLACLKHFLSNERDKARAKKRGGGRRQLSLDLEDAERRYRAEPVDELTAERVFERRWALTLLDQVLAALREEHAAAGKEERFERLKNHLTGQDSPDTYADTARRLDMTETAVKVAVHRLRRRYRDLLREEIARTVDDPQHVDDEIQDLYAALAS